MDRVLLIGIAAVTLASVHGLSRFLAGHEETDPLSQAYWRVHGIMEGSSQLLSFPYRESEWLMQISARNMLKGQVKQVIEGAVNDEIVIELPGGVEIVSVITKSSAEALGLAPGKEAYAVIKASNVMVMVD